MDTVLTPILAGSGGSGKKFRDGLDRYSLTLLQLGNGSRREPYRGERP